MGSNPVAGRKAGVAQLAERLCLPRRLDLGHNSGLSRSPPDARGDLFHVEVQPAGTRPAVTSPITSEATPSARTHEGATGYARDTKSELFLLAVSNKVGEDTFYEQASDRDDRYCALVHQAALEDPEWTARFLAWLRTEANMRSAALVGAAEFVKARLDGAGTRPGRPHETKDNDTRTWEGDSLGYSTYSNRRVIDWSSGAPTSPARCSPTGPPSTAGRSRSRSSAGSPTPSGACTTRRRC